jgi:hypothetical protein
MNSTIPTARAIYITMDTDWCADEVLAFALSLLRERHLPCTVFATHNHAALQNINAEMMEIGLHPNFSEVTAEGYEEKLQALQRLYPHAVGVSSHAMTSGTALLHLFRQYGLRYDRNILRYRDTEAKPFVYHNGLLRMPIFWEDDIWFTHEPGARFSADMLKHEGFRLIFNFHPIHLYMNTTSAEHYQTFKPYQRELQRLAQYSGTEYGALSFFEDLAAYIQNENVATGLLRDLLEK